MLVAKIYGVISCGGPLVEVLASDGGLVDQWLWWWFCSGGPEWWHWGFPRVSNTSSRFYSAPGTTRVTRQTRVEKCPILFLILIWGSCWYLILQYPELSRMGSSTSCLATRWSCWHWFPIWPPGALTGFYSVGIFLSKSDISWVSIYHDWRKDIKILGLTGSNKKQYE